MASPNIKLLLIILISTLLSTCKKDELIESNYIGEWIWNGGQCKCKIVIDPDKRASILDYGNSKECETNHNKAQGKAYIFNNKIHIGRSKLKIIQKPEKTGSSVNGKTEWRIILMFTGLGKSSELMFLKYE